MWNHPGAYYSDYAEASAHAPLARPVVVAGVVGVGLSSITTTIGSLTGWSVTELDRRVEHDAGRSLAHSRFKEGGGPVQARTRAWLDRALAEQPPALIAARAGVLAHPGVLEDAVRKAVLVVLRAPPSVLRAGVDALRARSPGSLPEPLPAGPVDPATVLVWSTRLSALLPHAHAVVDVDGRSPLRPARAVIAALGSLAR
jgi:shikimate kinase